MVSTSGSPASIRVLTGKGLSFGGSLARPEATGYGLVYITEEMARGAGKELAGKTVVISGSGNVAQYACRKAQELGAKLSRCLIRNGHLYDPDGIQLDVVPEIKQGHHGRIREYLEKVPTAQYFEGRSYGA